MGRSPDYKAAFLATLGANSGVLRALRGQRASAGTRRCRKRSPSSITPSSIRRSTATSSSTKCRDVYMHVEKETDGGPDRQRRQGRRDDVDAHALQLHRQQRRAADQDQGVRLRLHRADRCARREAVLPAVLRDDGGGHGHAVRLPAVQPDGRERFDHRLRQSVRAVRKRVRVRRHRQGQQLLPALGLPAALHVPGLHAAGGEARLPRRAAAQGRGSDRREGFSRRAGAGRRSAGVAQSVLGPDRRDGAHHRRRGRRATCCRTSTTGWRTA